jgi:DNA-binding MarR family transcriptional regulator
MIQRDSPFVMSQAIATLGRAALLERLAARGHADIGMPDIKLLWCLSDEPINVQRAAQMMGTTKQFAARTVASLKAAGLVRVAADAADKRAIAISASREGQRLLAIIAKERDAIEQEWRDVLGAPAYARLTEGMARLVDDLAKNETGPDKPAP